MSSLSLFHDGRPKYCAMRKLLPALRFSSFLVHHYYKQRHSNWLPTYEVDLHLHTNMVRPLPCWEAILKDNIRDLFFTLNESSAVIPIKTAR